MELVLGSTPADGAAGEDQQPLPSCRGAPGMVKQRLSAFLAGGSSAPLIAPEPESTSLAQPAEETRPLRDLPDAHRAPARLPPPAPRHHPSCCYHKSLASRSSSSTDHRASPPNGSDSLRRWQSLNVPHITTGSPVPRATPSPTGSQTSRSPSPDTKLRRARRRNSAPAGGHWDTLRAMMWTSSPMSSPEQGYSPLKEELPRAVSFAPSPSDAPPGPPPRANSMRRQSLKQGLAAHGMHAPASAPSGLAGIAKAALHSKVSVEHEVQQEAKEDAFAESHFFLSYKLMMREVHKRRGDHSWQSRVVKAIHSPLASTILISLLLIDVMVIFAELFLEGTYPVCSIILRDAISCCAASGYDAISQGGGHGSDGYGHGSHDAHRALSLHAHDVGHAPTCEAGLIAQPDNGVYCDPHAHAWVHQLETWFSLVTVFVLAVFEAELLGLLCALDGLFFRSALHIFDLVVISLSLVLQLYIYVVRWRGATSDLLMGGDGDPEAKAILPDDIQGLILFSRCWRFVRVGHGISTSITDMVRSKQVELHSTVEELKSSLRQVESEIYDFEHEGDGSVHGGGGAHKKKVLRHGVSIKGLHRAHDAITMLSQQTAY